jgi:uncharacterized membrane protein YdbT with pleckstrin-like domain
MKHEVSPLLQRLLREDEKLIWAGKPKKSAFMIANIVGTIIGAIIVTLFFGSFAFFILSVIYGFGVAVLSVIGLFFLILVVGILIAKRRYTFAEYAVTNERLIQFGGFIGRSYSSVEWEKVQDFVVHIGVFDRIAGTGTIRAAVAGFAYGPGWRGGGPGGMGVAFRYVPDAYKVLEIIEKARPKRK